MNSSTFADQDKVEFPSSSHHDPIKLKSGHNHQISSFQFPEYQESSKKKSGNNNQFRQLDFPRPRPLPSFNHFREDSDDSGDERATTQTWGVRSRFQPSTSHNQVLKLKIDLPHFDGQFEMEDFLDWIKKVENFFEYAEIPE